MGALADLIRPGEGRGLDFVVVDQLQKRTSIVPTEILKFAVSEMVSNSLDTDARAQPGSPRWTRLRR